MAGLHSRDKRCGGRWGTDSTVSDPDAVLPMRHSGVTTRTIYNNSHEPEHFSRPPASGDRRRVHHGPSPATLSSDRTVRRWSACRRLAAVTAWLHLLLHAGARPAGSVRSQPRRRTG